MILAFVDDLFFASKITPAAESLGHTVTWYGRSDQITQSEEMSLVQLRGEQAGIEGLVITNIVSWLHPFLIIFDLGNENIPWRNWLPILKSSPATRRIPIVCFGAHVNGESMKSAKSYGADGVFARSNFFIKLPDIIRKYALIPDLDGLSAECANPLSAKALIGLAQFNRGEYFEAHESLEEAWNEELAPGREIYRAILQIAVAYLQIRRRNYRGAVKIFLRARQWLDPLPAECRGVNIEQLRKDASSALEAVLSLAPDELPRLDQIQLQPVIYRFIE